MKRILLYLIGALLLMLIILSLQYNIVHKKYLQEKADRERLWKNNLQLFSENRRQTELIYTKDEFLKLMTDSLKKTLKQLHIKPKTVTQIIEKTITQEIHDTVFVPIQTIEKNHWLIQDTGACFIWQGEAKLFQDSLKINRINFEYNNKITDYYYRKLQWKFLFLRKYSRKEIIHKTVPQCGEVTEKIVKIQ